MSDIAVVTDSAASLPAPLARRWGVRVVPLEVTIDDESYREAADLSAEDVLDALAAGRKVTTSQPSAAAFTEEYAAAAAQGAAAIVSVHVTGAVSGTVNAARIAAEDAPVPVTVLDSASLAMGTGWAAVAAASKAAGGADAAAVAAEAERVAASSTVVFTVDTLEHLRRGGRIPATTAALGTALSIRPVLGMRDGEVVVLDRVRTTRRARDQVVAAAERAIQGLPRPGLAIMGLGAQGESDDAANLLVSRHPSLAVVVRTPVTAVLAVHAGPGAFAAVVADLPPELR